MKKYNEYQKLISAGLYEKLPKAVLAAIAVSFILNHQNGDVTKVDNSILEEWDVLHRNSIVPQKPIK